MDGDATPSSRGGASPPPNKIGEDDGGKTVMEKEGPPPFGQIGSCSVHCRLYIFLVQ